MSDDRPDEGAPSDPRPSGRIRIVGAQPATGEHPTVAAQRPPAEEPPPPPDATPAEPPPADDPNRFGAIPIISADEPPVDPTPPRGVPTRPDADEPPIRAVPDPAPDPAVRAAPDLDDLDLPPTAAVPVVPAADPEDLEDIRVWAAPDDDEPEIEAGRSANEGGRSAADDPFADLRGGEEDDLSDLLGPAPDDDLPHWGDPAAADEDEAWAGLTGGPRWRGQGEESGEPEDFSDLAETRVESLGEDEMIFDDLDAVDPIESPAGPPQRRNPYPEGEDDAHGGGGDGGSGFFPDGGGGGRDMQQAVIVGVGLVAVLFVCAVIGAKALVALVTIIVVMATAEFFTATRRAGYHPAVPLGLVGSGGFVLATNWRGEGAVPLMLFLVVVTSLCWWLFDAGPGDHAVANVGITVFGVMYVGGLGSFAALLLKFPDGIGMLFGAILVAVAADIGGLFVGQRMGKSPLSHASPHKTVEGFVGGIVAAVIASCVVLGVIGVYPWEFMDALILGVVGGIMTPLGDLCVSRLKRDLGVKDLGNLLPGHGGLLDRFDGMLFVLPATYYVVRLLEVYLNAP